MNNERRGFWGNIFDSNKALDTTLITAIAGAVAIIVVLKLFDTHQNESILTGEIIMALIALPTNLIMYALGKRSGESNNNGNGNGNGNGQADKNSEEIERIKDYLKGE